MTVILKQLPKYILTALKELYVYTIATNFYQTQYGNSDWIKNLIPNPSSPTLTMVKYNKTISF